MMVRYDAPDDFGVETLDLTTCLPIGNDRKFGPSNRAINSLATPLLRVPSAIVPLDRSPDVNILINHTHNDAARISVNSVEPFVVDPRLF
ncbi:RES family NAD+ phosphorylase [Bradyrhizobium sp. SRL28]|uniref:RES family NAD+ phosphorylase n=1 Tax=Bradyrhizobium sp. SRL28 TaxID=2836178 RepID=UPI00201C0388|nr:hypothetical protein [Bradyrhizobium sp. SRL28]